MPKPIDISTLNCDELVKLLADVFARLIAPLPATPADQREVAVEPAVRAKLLTVPEVADILGFAPGYTYELVRRGEIRAVHYGKYWRLTPAALEDFTRRSERIASHDRSLNEMLSRLGDRRSSQGSPKDARNRQTHPNEAIRRLSDNSESL